MDAYKQFVNKPVTIVFCYFPQCFQRFFVGFPSGQIQSNHPAENRKNPRREYRGGDSYFS